MYNLEKFETALSLLDEKLHQINEKILIYAIGGFNLLYRGIRVSGLTEDIDSLNKNEFSDRVKVCIAEVGMKLEMELNWLNTQWATIKFF